MPWLCLPAMGNRIDLHAGSPIWQGEDNGREGCTIKGLGALRKLAVRRFSFQASALFPK